jgi:hypothetical protein
LTFLVKAPCLKNVRKNIEGVVEDINPVEFQNYFTTRNDFGPLISVIATLGY